MQKAKVKRVLRELASKKTLPHKCDKRKHSAVSRQPSALWQRLWPLATLCERRWDFTKMKRMLTSCFIQNLFGVAYP
ncbi:hypothetical protein BJP36_39160 [Moorena producens JHB]|uniref:Uncharacterized protein n=1 Tax=Moorena producens (strain JHB) TaxID=1454205 RepID=A0A9Q9UWN6_MOOP1|nr:hypothetical protein [Moorena producens]WAN70084.1 hypothetical protein BJP36_39160 [Moorena producens JHB]